jgi:imidazolonepropionase-like amidohydrolase
VLPDGEVRDLFVVDGAVTYEAQPGAESLAEGWIVPGLVDAHCHVGLGSAGVVSPEESEQQAVQDRSTGALLLRDCGSPADTRWIDEREDLPRVVRAGRHLARTRRYLRGYAHEVEPEDLPAYVAQEAERGDGATTSATWWVTGSRTPGTATKRPGEEPTR